MKRETLLAQAGSRWDDRTGAISMPLYQSAVFRHEALGKSTGYDYARTASPTRCVLQDTLATLENGSGSAVFSSGLAAIDAVFRLLPAKGRVIATADMYGGTRRLLDAFHGTLEVIYIDTADTACVEAVFAGHAEDGGVDALFVEVPTNPLLRFADMTALAGLCKKFGALFIVDSTFLTPVLFRPLEHGADIVVHSATKYLSGHNDIVAGVAVARSQEHAEQLLSIQNSTGAILSANDSWLLLRSLKTLAVRVKRQNETAMRLADFLSGLAGVSKVHYPGLEGSIDHERMRDLVGHYGAMIAFSVANSAMVPIILESINVVFFAESLGGTETLLTYPRVQTHSDINAQALDAMGISPCLLRLSIGLEDAGDIMADIEQAVAKAAKETLQ